jgi:Holliday junction resolvase RusA-like endonuclease
MKYTIEIPGQPYAKKRHRSTKTGRTYSPEENVSFERTVGILAKSKIRKPIEGPVRLTVWATFAIPPSWSKKKQAAHLNGYHTQKPDLDNIEKAIKDGMNRIAWHDDSQVAEMSSRKVWGLTSRTIVIVEPIFDQSHD